MFLTTQNIPTELLFILVLLILVKLVQFIRVRRYGPLAGDWIFFFRGRIYAFSVLFKDTENLIVRRNVDNEIFIFPSKADNSAKLKPGDIVAFTKQKSGKYRFIIEE